MSVFFVFSDECGEYKQDRTEKFLKRHPYFVRASYIIRGEEWRALSQKHMELRSKYGLPPRVEIKWSYIWSVRSYQKRKESIPSGKDFHFLGSLDYHKLIKFVWESIALFSRLPYAKVIVTATFNRNVGRVSDADMYRWHLQEHMQRVEMELQEIDESLAVLFFDSLSSAGKNKLIREAYHSLYVNGDFIREYVHIKDGINFDDSQHSVGVQLADYIAGCSVGFLKGYRGSKEMFCKVVSPRLRQNGDGDPFGYGLREVPRDDRIRERIRTLFAACRSDGSSRESDIPWVAPALSFGGT